MQRGPDSTVSLAILLSPPPSLIPDKHHDPLPVCDLLSWTLTSINRFYLDCCYNVLQLPCPQRQQRTAHGLPCDSSARADSAPCAKGSPRPQWTISQKPHFYPKLLLSNVCGSSFPIHHCRSSTPPLHSFTSTTAQPEFCVLHGKRERGVFIGSTNRIDSKESPRRRRCRRRPSDVTAANYSFCAFVRACVCIYMYIPIIQFLSSKLPQYPLDSHL